MYRLHSSAASNFVTTSEAIKLNVVNLMALNLQLNAAQLQWLYMTYEDWLIGTTQWDQDLKCDFFF